MSDAAVRLPRPKVGDPIIFRPVPEGPEWVARPCSGKHREYWLAGYIVASCQKCTTEKLEPHTTPEFVRMRARWIAESLVDTTLQWASEDDLQREVAAHLVSLGFEPAREVRLSDGKSRVDLLVGTVGVEVKVAGSRSDVLRQLLRYSKCPEIGALVLATTRAAHAGVPAELNGKPVFAAFLAGGAL